MISGAQSRNVSPFNRKQMMLDLKQMLEREFDAGIELNDNPFNAWIRFTRGEQNFKVEISAHPDVNITCFSRLKSESVEKESSSMRLRFNTIVVDEGQRQNLLDPSRWDAIFLHCQWMFDARCGTVISFS